MGNHHVGDMFKAAIESVLLFKKIGEITTVPTFLKVAVSIS